MIVWHVESVLFADIVESLFLSDNKNTKIVFVGNLPPTATEAALKEIFTGATIIRIAREDDSSSKG